jgi:small subunit ribosomal protein S6
MPETPFYDLFVLLDPETPEEQRTQLIDRIRGQIDGPGTLKGDADWGMRSMTFEIDHRQEAQYHLFQFQGKPELLNELDRTLSIEDAVLRHRIIRLPGPAPEVTPKPSAEEPRRTEERGDRGRPPGRGPRPDGPEEEAGSENGTEAPATTQTAEPAETPAPPEPALSETAAAEAPAAEPAADPVPEEQIGEDTAASSQPDEPA